MCCPRAKALRRHGEGVFLSLFHGSSRYFSSPFFLQRLGKLFFFVFFIPEDYLIFRGYGGTAKGFLSDMELEDMDLGAGEEADRQEAAADAFADEAFVAAECVFSL